MVRRRRLSRSHQSGSTAGPEGQICREVAEAQGPKVSTVLKALPAQWLMSQLVTSNFWWVQSRADLDLEYSISDGSRAGFLISILVRWTLRLRVEECKKTSWRMALRSPGMKNCHKWDNSNGCTLSLRQVWTWNVWTWRRGLLITSECNQRWFHRSLGVVLSSSSLPESSQKGCESKYV